MATAYGGEQDRSPFETIKDLRGLPRRVAFSNRDASGQRLSVVRPRG
jgi:hypothetical protein